MMGGFANRRRADEFDALLSGRAVDAVEYDELLQLVRSIRALPEVTARPAYVADVRSRLVAAAAVELAAAKVDPLTTAKLTPRQRQGARERRIATALGGFAVVVASGSMAVAAQGALPGDVLYPMKRAIENAQTNLQSDDAERAETLLAHAEQRLVEVQELSARDDDGDAEQIAATLQDFTEQTKQATELMLDSYADTGDDEPLVELRDFAAESMADLTALGDAVPDDARPALVTAAQTVLQVDDQAFNVCPTCGDEPLVELPEFAALDPAEMLLDSAPLPETSFEPPITLPGDDTTTGSKDGKNRDKPDGGADDETDVTTDVATETPGIEDEDDPLGDIADDVKDGLGGGDKANTKNDKKVGDDLDEITTDLTDGVTGLVDGLLGD